MYSSVLTDSNSASFSRPTLMYHVNLYGSLSAICLNISQSTKAALIKLKGTRKLEQCKYCLIEDKLCPDTIC